MSRRRWNRLLQDHHRAPLIAFVLVAVACLVMTAHMARSQASSDWLRAGGESAPRAGQQVLGGELLERAVAPHAPPLVTPAPPPPSDDPTTTASPDQHPLPDAGAGEHQPQPSPQAAVAQVGGGPATPGTDAGPGGAPALIELPAGTPDDGGRAAGDHRADHLFPVDPGSAEPASDTPEPRDAHEGRAEWIGGDRDPKGHHDRGHRHR